MSVIEQIEDLLVAIPGAYATIRLLLWLGGAYLVQFVISGVLGQLAKRTKNKIDDQVIRNLRFPIFVSVIFLAIYDLVHGLFDVKSPIYEHVVNGLQTMAILLWALTIINTGEVVLHGLSRAPGIRKVVQPRTLPIFNLVFKVTVAIAAAYFLFLAWKIDLTAWLASAGILGIALGFAAKDSLANFFAGVFILADSPYQLGDFIVIDGTLRGRVSQIGIRSTRIVTRDDVEITIPNALMGTSKIVNEAGGPDVSQRTRIAVSAAYGSDVELVIEVLLGVVEGVNNVVTKPTPQTRFRAFGGSGLEFELLVWVDDAAERGRVIHDLNMRIYKAFGVAGIEIPYSKHDVYIKQAPAGLFEAASENEPGL